ncbi:hypothetical protein SNEBB_000295 [Seison nebaliae]|nr:hypothetical protein SNEBB_000295 [Seison nebaliae]
MELISSKPQPFNILKKLNFTYSRTGTNVQLNRYEEKIFKILSNIINEECDIYLEQTDEYENEFDNYEENKENCSNHDNLTRKDDLELFEEDFIDSDDESDLTYAENIDSKTATPFKKKKLIVNYWRDVRKGRRSFSSVKNRYPSVDNVRRLYEYESQILEVKNQQEQLFNFKETLYEHFLQLRAKNIVVKDIDLLTIGSKLARYLDIPFLTLSQSYITKFKQRFGIVSRKITKFTTTKEVDYEEIIEENARIFVHKIKDMIFDQKISKSKIINSDQSGFNLELTSGRTLSEIGKKHIPGLIRNKSACTHSYTIMPIINAMGEFVGPLYVILK